jgi:hypothetical protein
LIIHYNHTETGLATKITQALLATAEKLLKYRANSGTNARLEDSKSDNDRKNNDDDGQYLGVDPFGDMVEQLLDKALERSTASKTALFINLISMTTLLAKG